MKRPQRAAITTFFAATLALVALMLQPSSAQVVIGHGGGPEVQINLGALDNLPPSGPVPDGQARARLKRPGGVAKSAAPKASTKHKATAKAKPAAKRSAAAHKPAKSAVTASAKTKPTKTASIADTEGGAQPPAKIETAKLPAGPADAKDGATPPASPPAASSQRPAEPAATPQTAEAPPAPKPPIVQKPTPAPKQSAPPPTAVATTEPAPAPAAPTPAAPAAAGPAVVAGGLLGGGVSDASEPLRSVNVPSRGAPVAAAPRERQQMAAVAPGAAGAAAGAGGFRVGFSGSNADLSPAAQSQLAALAQLLAGSNDRIILNGYASGESASGARRVALSRVLAVRAFLVDKGVQQPRIDVRAVGTPSDGGSPERVDIAKIGR